MIFTNLLANLPVHSLSAIYLDLERLLLAVDLNM